MRARIISGRGVALWGLTALLAASPARAAQLWIVAPSACPIDDELSFRAERALGEPLESAAPVRCAVQIVRDGGEFAARLEVRALDPLGSAPSRVRSLRAPTCEKLTETLALAVALAIASGKAAKPASASPPGAFAATGAVSAGDAAATADVDRAHDVETAPTPNSASGDGAGWRFGPSAALVADAGTLPGIGMGVSLGAAIGADAFELRGLGTYLPPRSTTVEVSGAGSARAEIELLAAGLLACAPRLAKASGLEFGACAGGELGWLAGTGRNIAVARSGGSSWSALRADAGSRWLLGRDWTIDLLLSALVPWARDEFAIEGVGRVFRPSSVVGRVALGLRYEFGSSPGR